MRMRMLLRTLNFDNIDEDADAAVDSALTASMWTRMLLWTLSFDDDDTDGGASADTAV